MTTLERDRLEVGERAATWLVISDLRATLARANR